MTATIPITAVPSQQLSITLANQNCQITLYMMGDYLYMDLAIDNAPIASGVLCLDRTKLIRDAYLGFVGDLAFIDTLGTSDPTYDGLGDRYQLVYLP